MIRFSVIIPMYNVASYIERCLKSVVSQNFPKDRYEMILVNDGSPDNSEQIAREFCRGIKNVKIIRQGNKGLGGARNTGIDQASGQYLIFLDSDDYLLNSFFSVLDDSLNNHDIMEFSCAQTNGESELNVVSFKEKEFAHGYEYILNSKSINSACNKVYARDFLNQNNLRFKEKIYGEDIQFNNRTYFFAEKTGSITNKLIGFYQNPDSITRNPEQNKKIKYLSDLQNTIIEFKEFICNNEGECNLSQKTYLQYRLSRSNVNTLLYALKNRIPYSELKAYTQALKSSNAFYMDAKLKSRNLYRILLKNKICLWLLMLFLCKKQ